MSAVRHLTQAELAARLGVPEDTVKRWRRTRTGPPFFRAGRHVRYRETEVEKWEQSRLVTPRA